MEGPIRAAAPALSGLVAPLLRATALACRAVSRHGRGGRPAACGTVRAVCPNRRGGTTRVLPRALPGHAATPARTVATGPVTMVVLARSTLSATLAPTAPTALVLKRRPCQRLGGRPTVARATTPAMGKARMMASVMTVRLGPISASAKGGPTALIAGRADILVEPDKGPTRFRFHSHTR